MDMKKLLLAFCLCYAFSASATELTDKNFLNVNSCFSGTTATFDTWWSFLASKPGMAKHMVRPDSQHLQAGLRKKFEHYQSTIICENFDYLVDGVQVRGFYVAPKLAANKRPNAQKNKLPLLIFNRGGNGDFGVSLFGYILEYFFPMAEQGFVVVGSQYRGYIKNISNSGADEFGGKDLNDVLKLVDLADFFPQADSKRIGMYGFSRGGMMTYMAAKQSKQLKSIAVVGGVSDLHSSMQFRPEMENVYKKRIPNYNTQKASALAERSAILWADKIPKSVPILLLHGGNDERVNVDQARAMDQKLTELQHPHKLVIYEGDNHSLGMHQKELETELVAWFKETLSNKKP
jgi:dipeptidyl aminopeptidase/acylaminoacyl peptidase